MQDIYNLVSGELLRLRLGIGEPLGAQRRDEFVLAPFHRNELPLLDQGLLKTVAALDIWLALGPTVAQNECNGNRAAVVTLEDVLRRRAQRRELQQQQNAAKKPPSAGSTLPT